MSLLLMGCFGRQMPKEPCQQAPPTPEGGGAGSVRGRKKQQQQLDTINPFGSKGVSYDSKNPLQQQTSSSGRPPKQLSSAAADAVHDPRQHQQQQQEAGTCDFDPSLFVLGDRAGSCNSARLPPCTPSRTRETKQGRYEAMCICVEQSPGSFQEEACSSRISASPAVDQTALSMTTSSFVSAHASNSYQSQAWQGGSWCGGQQQRRASAAGTSMVELSLSPGASFSQGHEHPQQQQQQQPRPRSSLFTAPREEEEAAAAATAAEAAADEGWGVLDPDVCSWDHSFCSLSSLASFNDPYKHGRMISDDLHSQQLGMESGANNAANQRPV